jgi:2'-5' RNA ligase
VSPAGRSDAGGVRARLFVAASLPVDVSAELARWARTALGAVGAVSGGAVGGARRLAPEAMHITLCFLGEQPLACVDELAAVLGAAAEPVAAIGELALGAPVFLPLRHPRVLAVEVGDPDGGLGRLRSLLVREIATTIGWAPGRERFRPHVTVARMRAGIGGRRGRFGGRSAEHMARNELLASGFPPTPQLCFAADKVVLLRSHLEPEGAR